jgi:hypothetical protein
MQSKQLDYWLFVRAIRGRWRQTSASTHHATTWSGIREETRYENNMKQVHDDFIRVNNLIGFTLAESERGWNTGPPRCEQVSHWRWRGYCGGEGASQDCWPPQNRTWLLIQHVGGAREGSGASGQFLYCYQSHVKTNNGRSVRLFWNRTPIWGPWQLRFGRCGGDLLTARRIWKCLPLCLSFNVV